MQTHLSQRDKPPTERRSATTDFRSGKTLPVYASSSFWNVAIPSAPVVDVNSSGMLSTSILPYQSRANLDNSAAWGISVVTASATDKVYTLINPTWGSQAPVSFRIPVGAQPSTGSDHHLVVIDGSQELDLWDGWN